MNRIPFLFVALAIGCSPTSTTTPASPAPADAPRRAPTLVPARDAVFESITLPEVRLEPGSPMLWKWYTAWPWGPERQRVLADVERFCTTTSLGSMSFGQELLCHSERPARLDMGFAVDDDILWMLGILDAAIAIAGDDERASALEVKLDAAAEVDLHTVATMLEMFRGNGFYAFATHVRDPRTGDTIVNALANTDHYWGDASGDPSTVAHPRHPVTLTPSTSQPGYDACRKGWADATDERVHIHYHGDVLEGVTSPYPVCPARLNVRSASRAQLETHTFTLTLSASLDTRWSEVLDELVFARESFPSARLSLGPQRAEVVEREIGFEDFDERSSALRRHGWKAQRAE